MAYPTEEDDALLAERGFDKTKSGYIRKRGLETHGIEPTGANDLHSLDAPSGEVYWSAWCVIANIDPRRARQLRPGRTTQRRSPDPQRSLCDRRDTAVA